MPSTFSLTVVSGGLYPAPGGGQTSLVTGGLFSITRPQLGAYDSSPSIIAAQNPGIKAGISAQIGNGLVPSGISASLSIPIGNANLSFSLSDIIQNPTSLTGRQVFNPNAARLIPDIAEDNIYANSVSTYTGSDLRVIVDMVNTSTQSTTTAQFKQLIECTTFTVSIHREKAAVRASGYINPKGFARGRRTIAGTMVLTQFNVDILYDFLMAQQLSSHDLSKDTQYVKVDQLPPFNMTLLFSDEYGNASYQRVLGVDFVTDGVVYSSNDMLAERTISYMASDFTPLVNGNATAVFTPSQISQILASERTVQTVLSSGQQFAVPPTNIFSQA